MPVPKNLPNMDRNKCVVLEDFDKDGMNSDAAGGKARVDEEEEDGMPRGGQRVQCQQQ